MLKKSAASVLLALIVTPGLSAATFGSWTQGVSRYDLDGAQEACVASTTIDKNATLTLVFPKDRKSLPLVRVTERYRNIFNPIKYLGVRYLDKNTNLKVHGFPAEIGDRQYYYMVPTSASNFNSFINTIRAKSTLDVIKLFSKSGKLVFHPANFSLAGSTNATNALKTCLGSSSFISSSQARLINVLQKYKNEATASNPGTDISSLNRRGAIILRSMQNVLAEGDRLQPLESELRTLESDERYLELKKDFESNTRIRTTEGKIIDVLTDNQDFYSNSDQIISDIEKEISRLGSLLSGLENEKTQIAARLVEIETEISRQNQDLNLDRQVLNNSSSELTGARSTLGQVNRDISDVTREINEKEQRLRNLQLDVRPLRSNLQTARARYDDRERLKREARRRLTDRYGTREELRNSIDDANQKLGQAKTAKQVNTQIESSVNNVSEKANDLKMIRAQLTGNTESISCIEKLIAEGGEDKPRRACGMRIRKSLTETLDRLNQNKTRLETSQSEDLVKLQNRLSNLPTPRRGNNIIKAISDLKSCDGSKPSDCISKARVVSNLVKRRLESNNSNISDKEKVLKEETAKLTRLEQGLRDQVRGLDETLRAEVAAARRALDANDLVTRQTIDRVDFLEGELDSLLRSQDRLNRQVAASQIAYNNALSTYEQTARKLEDYKISVGYTPILDRQSQVVQMISDNTSRLNSSNRSLVDSRRRKQEIAAEIDSYPERITSAQAKRDAAEVVLNDIGPEYNELANNVSRVRSAYSRLVADLRPALISFQREFKTVIKNLF